MCLDGLFAHMFRHTAITRLLPAKVTAEIGSKVRRHPDPQTTLRYAPAIDADQAISAVDSLAYP